MSGPKDYKTYTIDAFKGKLDKVLLSQVQLGNLLADVEKMAFSDTILGISYNCKDDLSLIITELNASKKTLFFDHKGSFNQSVYDAIEREILTKIAKIDSYIAKLNEIKLNFSRKKTDYESYVNYLKFHNNACISFTRFKTKITHEIKADMIILNPIQFTKTEQEIKAIKLTLNKPIFDWGFSQQQEKEKQSLIQHIRDKENIIYQIAGSGSMSILRELQDDAGNIKLVVNVSESDKEKAEWKAKIELLISNCDDDIFITNYTSQLSQLINSKTLTDIYFYKELWETIRTTEVTRNRKQAILAIINEIAKVEWHKSVQGTKLNLLNLLNKGLENTVINTRFFEEIEDSMALLMDENKVKLEEDALQQKKNQFIKLQLIASLENLGYEVMDDLSVIDFDKHKSFYLKVRGQENFINLHFREDGSFRYRFEIPEDVADLTTSKEEQKLNDMKISCEEFQEALTILENMGLNLQAKTLKVSKDTLFSLPNEKRKEFQKASKVVQKEQIKKKYLK